MSILYIVKAHKPNFLKTQFSSSYFRPFISQHKNTDRTVCFHDMYKMICSDVGTEETDFGNVKSG